MGKERDSYKDGREEGIKEGKKNIITTIIMGVLLIIAAPTMVGWFGTIINSNSNQNNNSAISSIENENVELSEEKQPTKESNEILATENSSRNDFPIDMSLYLESGYKTNFYKYNKDGKTYIFHEFSTGDGKQGLENNKQGLYCVDTKQWVLAAISFDYYDATWNVYYIDDGKFYHYHDNGKDESLDGWTEAGFPNCAEAMANCVRSLGLLPIESANDEAIPIDDINYAFNLIGYTPE